MKKIKRFITDNKKFLIQLSLFVLLFLILSIFVITNAIGSVDNLIHSSILKIRNDNLTSFLTVITNFAGASFLLAVSVILIIILKNKKHAFYIFINLVLAFFINEVFKSMFVRSRPVGINLIEETGYSFPSGHSMVALSFYGFITYLLYKKLENKFMKALLIFSSIALILFVGFSRIYLGVHYLSDVLGGFMLSIIYLLIFIRIIKLERK